MIAKHILNLKFRLQMEKTLKKNVNIILTDYKCESCNKFFSIPQKLKKHINSVHNGQKDHKCDCCGMILAYIVRTFF